jgi:hypothetical protein
MKTMASVSVPWEDLKVAVQKLTELIVNCLANWCDCLLLAGNNIHWS